MHVGDPAAVKPYLNVVGLGENLHRVPPVAVHERLVRIHCKEHLAGAIERARIALGVLVFEDVGLVRLRRRLVAEPDTAVAGPLDAVGNGQQKILVRRFREQVAGGIVVALGPHKFAAFDSPPGIADRLPAGQVPAIEDRQESLPGPVCTCSVIFNGLPTTG
ncbi:hypothetical protein ES703_09713 [subsurface metagenome]